MLAAGFQKHIIIGYCGQEDMADTPRTLASCLDRALIKAGLESSVHDCCFPPDVLPFQQYLQQNMASSLLVVLVLSRGFASSACCLDQLAIAVKQQDQVPLLPVWHSNVEGNVTQHLIDGAIRLGRLSPSDDTSDPQRLARWIEAILHLGSVTVAQTDLHDG